MTTTLPDTKRAESSEAIVPLVELCKAGRLFEIQEWIASGKPVNPPVIRKKGTKPRSPLNDAIDRGFHSLVQVLLEGGAAQEPEGYYSPMNRALRARRLDIVQLLIEHGFDAQTVDMREVFSTWDPKIMSYFLERGADLRSGNPFAWAFCNRIQTALRFFKDSCAQQPEIHEQANIALRHHCKEGNLKWVSLMLWGGADPHKPGPDNPDEDFDEHDYGLSALGYAALYRHYEMFEIKSVRAREGYGDAVKILAYLTRDGGIEILKRLLEKGVNPNDQDNGGCSTIRSCLSHMGMARHFNAHSWERDANGRNLDTGELRDRLKAVHLLASHGAKWIPEDNGEINSARRALLYLKPDYTMEFVWIMAKYKACALEHIETLLRTPTMKAHTVSHRTKLIELLGSWS